MTLFGNRNFEKKIQLKLSHSWVGWVSNPIWVVLLWIGGFICKCEGKGMGDTSISYGWMWWDVHIGSCADF
jgi:hypothetical protein